MPAGGGRRDPSLGNVAARHWRRDRRAPVPLLRAAVPVTERARGPRRPRAPARSRRGRHPTRAGAARLRRVTGGRRRARARPGRHVWSPHSGRRPGWAPPGTGAAVGHGGRAQIFRISPGMGRSSCRCRPSPRGRRAGQDGRQRWPPPATSWAPWRRTAGRTVLPRHSRTRGGGVQPGSSAPAPRHPGPCVVHRDAVTPLGVPGSAMAQTETPERPTTTGAAVRRRRSRRGGTAVRSRRGCRCRAPGG